VTDLGCQSLGSNLSKSSFSHYPTFDRFGRRCFNEDDGEVEADVGKRKKKKRRRKKSMRERDSQSFKHKIIIYL
jgi:hypothetical protein